MDHVKSLPADLAERHRAWRDGAGRSKQDHYRRLAADGQRPTAMVISCCDSRVHATELFDVATGEFFMHRNIANLVPGPDAAAALHGTAAAVEYAVTALKVSHLIVMGHARCGGVQGSIDLFEGRAPQLEGEDSYVGRWIRHLKPGYEAAKAESGGEPTPEAVEKRAVLASLENLMALPFVRSAVEAGTLSLHGLWTDIASGAVQGYDPEQGRFVAL